MAKDIQGLRLVKRSDSSNWYIHGTVFGKEVRRSTKTSDREIAEALLVETFKEIRNKILYGDKPRRTWEEGVIKYLDYAQKSSLVDDVFHIGLLEKFLKGKYLDEIDDDTLLPFIKSRRKDGVKSRTINMSLQMVRRILNLSARKWRWINVPPLIDFVPEIDKKYPYPLSWDEQILLFNALPSYLKKMCLFKVNTGTRCQEVCQLEWKWLVKRDDNIWFFEIPKELVKNRLPRIVILNDIAKSVIEQCQGNGSKYVFPFNGKPICRIGNTGFQKARKKVGLSHVRVHDLKHTYGARLRAAGVPEEDRKFLLGHKSGMSMTTHYSVPELKLMLEYSNRVCSNDNNLVLLKRRSEWKKSVSSTKSAQSPKKKRLRLLATP